MGDGSGQDGSWLVKVAGCTIYGTQNFSIKLRRSHSHLDCQVLDFQVQPKDRTVALGHQDTRTC